MKLLKGVEKFLYLKKKKTVLTASRPSFFVLVIMVETMNKMNYLKARLWIWFESIAARAKVLFSRLTAILWILRL